MARAPSRPIFVSTGGTGGQIPNHRVREMKKKEKAQREAKRQADRRAAKKIK
jgi:hypothetical protein